MAIQNALVQVALKEAPATVVMTTNITRLTMDVGKMLLSRNPDDAAKARSRAMNYLVPGRRLRSRLHLGAAGDAALGLWSLALAAGLALIALVIADH